MSYHLVLHDLSNLESSKYYYINIIMEYTSPTNNITSLLLYIDRGVTDFDRLGNILWFKFPKLCNLKIIQNYSFGNNANTINFLNFLQLLKLNEFTLNDFQSEFLKKITIDGYIFCYAE